MEYGVPTLAKLAGEVSKSKKAFSDRNAILVVEMKLFHLGCLGVDRPQKKRMCCSFY